MLDALRSFVRRLGSPEPEKHFDNDDRRLALAALLVHCTAVDGVVSDAERGKLREVLGATFGLDGRDLTALIDDAIAADEDAVDLYRFTSVLKRQMSEADRIVVVGSLWEIVFVDGSSHEFEENLVWRVAELLGVDTRDRVATKRAVAENRLRQQSGNG